MTFGYVWAMMVAHAWQLLAFAAIFVVLERLAPAHREQSQWRSDSRLDLTFSFVGPLLVTPFYFFTASLLSAWLWRAAPTELAAIRSQNPWLQFLLALLLMDFIGYWRHRIMHCRPLWPFHAVHHSSKELDWLSNERNHPINQYINAIVNLVALAALFHPLVVAATVSCRRFYSLFLHANVGLSYGPWSYVFVSPQFHHWHHSDDRAAIDKNYAIFFSFLDWIFGTFYFPKGELPRSYGLHRDAIPARFLSQLAHPFERLGRAAYRRIQPFLEVPSLSWSRTGPPSRRMIDSTEEASPGATCLSRGAAEVDAISRRSHSFSPRTRFHHLGLAGAAAAGGDRHHRPGGSRHRRTPRRRRLA